MRTMIACLVGWQRYLCLIILLLFNKFSNAEIIDLDRTNWETTITANTWTAILFYDADDTATTRDHVELLQGLQQELKIPSLTLARLDIRHHNYYRQIYQDQDDDEPFLEAFYTNYNHDPAALLGISDFTFLNLKGDIYWNTKVILLGSDLNVYGEFPLDYVADVPHKVSVLTQWLQVSIAHKTLEDLEIFMESPTHTQLEARNDKEPYSFDFERYHHYHAPQDAADVDTLVLQTGVRKAFGDGPFAYKHMPLNWAKDAQQSLEELGHVIRIHLQWAESYDVLWDEDRKAREEDQTQYGTHLTTLNTKVLELWKKIFVDKEVGIATKDDETKLKPTGKGTTDIPTLLPYLEEMVFGYGRSPQSLQTYIQEELVASLGATPKERQTNRQQPLENPFVERIKEYMRLFTNAAIDNDRFKITLAELVQQYHNLLVDFQTNLQESYAKVDPKPTDFSKASLMVLDMNDNNNRDILTNYTAFHEQYTQTGTPVVLSNVELTKYNLTLEHILNHCGHVDVTDQVKWGPPVGKATSKLWAGLHDYELDKALASEDRKIVDSDDDDEQEEEEEEEDEEEDVMPWESWDIDADLTLEQFAAISKHVAKPLYLYDAKLLGACDKLLYETTLYGQQQILQLPYVLAAYDLAQRVTIYPDQHDSPSLTWGNGGTHAKLQTQSRGYFLYLVAGSKRWTIYNRSERPYLYSRVFTDSFVPDVLGLNLLGLEEYAKEQLSFRFPLLHRTEQVYEVVQEAGQLVYIPPDCPFAEENLEDGTVGLAFKVVVQDVAYGAHLHEQIHRYRNFGFVELALRYKLFGETADQPTAASDDEGLYMSYADYKAQQ